MKSQTRAVYYCWYKQGDPNPPSRYVAFGGMYGYGASMQYVNPVTGTQSCPAGYTSSSVFGTSGTDYAVVICWKERAPIINTPPGPLDQMASFGGMYGFGLSTNYSHPLETGTNCPATYHAAQMLGTSNTDYNLFLCYKLQTDFISQ